MKNAIKWFEIPVKDLRRAKEFYEGIFEISLQDFNNNGNFKMALFPNENGTIGGALCEHEDFYIPSGLGTLIYLNADPNLEDVLERLRTKKGRIIQPKTLINEAIGYMAVIEDSEGNRIALMSQN